MQVLQIDESQTEFAHLLDLVQNRNETVVIEYGRHRRKVAMIVPYREEKHPRVFGPYKGKGSFRLHSDFAMSESELSGDE